MMAKALIISIHPIILVNSTNIGSLKKEPIAGEEI